ncbi:sigma-70 family RNA polymerase sigma factor [Hymenobacter aerilatus]|uniref:Sigma-70 family RNA polymerase sigma factor n=1 Tax=Hymenobacter aerilatus TaxID=2932251 RepID=A0A8T9SVW7_9BACT|nr:sigma-70 family RNA polymerase sigma factor [Hymenobacter aerilatus]UOR03926.1 sigma-70 family RNA polymerase sigma factor [Hymenobacter aerilatus]
MLAAPPDFLVLLNEYQPLLRRVCRLYCVDADDRQDLYQEIVTQLWQAWPRYQPRPDVKLSTWLYRVALNVAISDLRQRTRRPTSTHLDAAQLPNVPLPPADGPDTDDLHQLYRAINCLSDVDKAFVLLYLEERTYEEMADILGITQNNVRVKMHRVQEKLRQLLTQPA